MFVLNPADGLCCAWFISIDWVQVNGLHLEVEAESSLRNIVFLNKNIVLDINHDPVLI
jgi:hypothetical protein